MGDHLHRIRQASLRALLTGWAANCPGNCLPGVLYDQPITVNEVGHLARWLDCAHKYTSFTMKQKWRVGKSPLNLSIADLRSYLSYITYHRVICICVCMCVCVCVCACVCVCVYEQLLRHLSAGNIRRSVGERDGEGVTQFICAS